MALSISLPPLSSRPPPYIAFCSTFPTHIPIGLVCNSCARTSFSSLLSVSLPSQEHSPSYMFAHVAGLLRIGSISAFVRNSTHPPTHLPIIAPSHLPFSTTSHHPLVSAARPSTRPRSRCTDDLLHPNLETVLPAPPHPFTPFSFIAIPYTIVSYTTFSSLRIGPIL